MDLRPVPRTSVQEKRSDDNVAAQAAKNDDVEEKDDRYR